MSRYTCVGNAFRPPPVISYLTGTLWSMLGAQKYSASNPLVIAPCIRPVHYPPFSVSTRVVLETSLLLFGAPRLSTPSRGGKYDHGEGIILPEGKTLSSGQFDEVAAALKERQAEVVILLEEETSR